MQSLITVEDLCKKLRPIFGKKIEQLYTRYAITESREKRQEIESVLNALYQKYLSSSLLNEKVLLEPPEKDIIKGEYPLGIVTYADRELYTFGLREKDWIRHICISGMSGSGSTEAFKLLPRTSALLVGTQPRGCRYVNKLPGALIGYSMGSPRV